MIAANPTRANRGRDLIATALVVAIAVVLVTAQPPHAAEAKKRTISVTINKGETYVIEGVRKDAAPKSEAQNNPNAMLVRTDAPGRIVLVGADAGSRKLEVTLASGEKVIYAITVKALAPPQGSLEPVAAPTVMP